MNIQSNDKIDRIFKATFELISENGIHNTPVSAISKKSGVAAGTIYHYFESKVVLINALYLYLKDEMLHAVMDGHDAGSEYKARFFRIWNNYYNYMIGNPNILSFVEQCSNIPIITDDTQKKADAIVSPLLKFFQAGINNGTLKQDNVYLIVSLFHGSVVSLAKLQISGQLTITEEMKFSVAEFCWKGLN
jgi:AcrR family transcriptional regulator